MEIDIEGGNERFVSEDFPQQDPFAEKVLGIVDKFHALAICEYSDQINERRWRSFFARIVRAVCVEWDYHQAVALTTALWLHENTEHHYTTSLRFRRAVIILLAHCTPRCSSREALVTVHGVLKAITSERDRILLLLPCSKVSNLSLVSIRKLLQSMLLLPAGSPLTGLYLYLCDLERSEGEPTAASWPPLPTVAGNQTLELPPCMPPSVAPPDEARVLSGKLRTLQVMRTGRPLPFKLDSTISMRSPVVDERSAILPDEGFRKRPKFGDVPSTPIATFGGSVHCRSAIAQSGGLKLGGKGVKLRSVEEEEASFVPLRSAFAFHGAEPAKPGRKRPRHRPRTVEPFVGRSSVPRNRKTFSGEELMLKTISAAARNNTIRRRIEYARLPHFTTKSRRCSPLSSPELRGAEGALTVLVSGGLSSLDGFEDGGDSMLPPRELPRGRNLLVHSRRMFELERRSLASAPASPMFELHESGDPEPVVEPVGEKQQCDGEAATLRRVSSGMNLSGGVRNRLRPEVQSPNIGFWGRGFDEEEEEEEVEEWPPEPKSVLRHSQSEKRVTSCSRKSLLPRTMSTVGECRGTQLFRMKDLLEKQKMIKLKDRRKRRVLVRSRKTGQSLRRIASKPHFESLDAATLPW